jgi:16S rRNA processing protein RimM
VRMHKGRPIIQIDGIDDANAAETIIGAQVLLARDDVRLARDEYFDEDLVGCRVIDAAGSERGIVVEVLHYPHQDMLAVGAQHALVPLIAQFVKTVDVARKEIRVDVPPGLLDPAEADQA